jgi:hypothetical protein
MKRRGEIYFSVDRTPEGRLQLSINDDDGGYRIHGPKYDGRSVTVVKHIITVGDAKEISSYLKCVGASQPTEPETTRKQVTEETK